MHEAFFFGPADRQIFAIYHPPVIADKRVLTVICPPLFAEFNRTHSILRKLAVSLAEHGQHVLRIDYSGTGDSFGNLEELTLSDWVDDIALAVQEGRDLSGCTTVRILGVRASALLACKAATTMSDVERLVLWDPVSDGRQYLKELQIEQLAILEQHPHLERPERNRLSNQLGMYDISPTMINEFRDLGSDSFEGISAENILVVNTTPENQLLLPEVTSVELRVNCDWKTNTAGIILSQPILESLSNNLKT